MRLHSALVLFLAWVLLWYAVPYVHTQSVAPTAMVTVPAGPFTMGNNTGPADERPAHQVHLSAFAIDRTAVTNAQFAAFLHAVGPVNAQGERLFDVADRDARIHCDARIRGRRAQLTWRCMLARSLVLSALLAG